MDIFYILTGIVLVAWLTYRYRKIVKVLKNPPVADHESVVTLTDKNFDHHIKNKIMLVDFWAAWCMPCRMMAPVLNEMAGQLKGNAAIGKVDVELYQSLAGRFNVRNIPTMILFKNGMEVDRFVGLKSKDLLLKRIADLDLKQSM